MRSSESATSSSDETSPTAHEPRLLDGREERELHRGEPTSALHAPSSAPEVGVPGQHEIDTLSRSLALDVGILGWTRQLFPFLYRSTRADSDPLETAGRLAHPRRRVSTQIEYAQASPKRLLATRVTPSTSTRSPGSTTISRVGLSPLLQFVGV